MSAFETVARRALWLAIEAWPDTQSAFQQKYKFEDSLISINADGDPDPPACPSIAIFPLSETFEWKYNRTQENVLNFPVVIYTQTHNILAAEDLFAKVRDAIWKAEYSSGVSFIRKYTGEPPLRLSNVSMKLVFFGKTIPGVKTSFTVQLRRLNDPLPETSA